MPGIIGSAISKSLIVYMGVGMLAVVAVSSTASYFMGHGKASKYYLELDRDRVAAEGKADLEAFSILAGIDKKAAVAMAERVGRAEQRAEDAIDREKSAWKIEAKTRKENATLTENIIRNQQEAAANGDVCGGAMLSNGVQQNLEAGKEQVRELLDKRAGKARDGEGKFQAITGNILPLPVPRVKP